LWGYDRWFTYIGESDRSGSEGDDGGEVTSTVADSNEDEPKDPLRQDIEDAGPELKEKIFSDAR
jgi:hypothetical protein